MASRLLPGVLRCVRALAGAAGVGERGDAELLQQFVARRDEGAFATLLERHGPLVLGVCRQVLGDAHDAEDAFQATFLILARKAASLRRHESLAAWLHRVAVNVSRTARRNNARRRAHEREAILMARATPAADEAVRDWQPVLHEEVDRLPEKYRVPVVLCYFEGRSHDQAARELGWPLGTVKGRLARARDLLRARLTRRGLALSAGGLAAALAESPVQAAVPPALLGLTLRAAVSFVRIGTRAGGAVSAGAVALARGALQTTIATKLFPAVVLLVAVALTTCALVAGMAPEAQRADALPPLPGQADGGPQTPGRPSDKTPDSPTGPEKRENKEGRPKGPASDLHGDPLPPGALARLGTVRFRPPMGTTSLAFLPGDTTLLTVGGSSFSVWEVATGKELRRFNFKGSSSTFALAPGGKAVAVGTYVADPTEDTKTGVISLLDVATGRVLREFRGHGEAVRSLAFATDGKTLVSGSHDRTARLWDVSTGKELRRFDEPDIIMAVALAPDGKTAATTSFHSPNTKWTVRLLDAATGKEQGRFQADMPVFHLLFSPDGKTLVALEPANGGKPTSTIHLWDVVTGKLRELPGQPDCLYAAAFAPDGKTLATGSQQGIVVWDAVTAKERVRLGGQAAWTWGLSFSGDGKLLASVGSGAVHLWDVVADKERPVPAEGHQGSVEALAFLPDGKTLASAGQDCTLRLWEVAGGRPIRQDRLSAGTTDLGPWFAPDGSTLAWRAGKRIAQLDVATSAEGRQAGGKPLRSFDFSEVVYFFDVSPDGKLLAAYTRDRVLRLVDRATGKVLREFAKYPDLVSGLAFAPDARTLAVAVEDDSIRLEDTTTGKQRALLRFPTSPGAFAFSPDGKTLTVALGDNRLALLEVATGGERLALRVSEHADRLAHSPDGKLLALGSQAGTIHLRELATGKEMRRLEGHHGGVSCLAFSADGRRLASGGHDTTILTWDVADLNAKPPAANLSPKELEALWTDLAGADAARAYRAMQALAAAPGQAVPFLGRQLRAAPAADPKRLARLIADLDDDQFEAREKATRELEDLGSSAGPALRKALDGQPSAEVRRRVEALLQRLERFLQTPEDLRGGRAVEVLEHIATPEARTVLEEWSRRAPALDVTAEAKSALQRLAKQLPRSP
jgi:RNA polymerase sigma factor (sigma-70 family)